MDLMTEILWISGAFILAGIAFFWVYQQYDAYVRSVAEGRLANVEIDSKRMGLFRILVPIVRKSPLYDWAAKIKYFDEKKKRFNRIIVSAGLGGRMDGNDIYGMRIFMCVVVPAFFTLLSIAQDKGLPMAMIGFSALGWFVPSALLSGLRRRRQTEINLALPTVLDLLTLSTEAGLDFMGGLQKVVEKSKPSALIEELDQVTREIKLGASRAEALRNMAQRVDMTEISSFVAILVSADQMGGSIGRVLRAQSDAVRTVRFVRAERAGARASQLMLFPMIFLILPAVFVMIVGPMIVAFFYSGGPQ